MTRNLLFVGFLAALVPACTSPNDLVDDQLEDGADVDGKADSTRAYNSYYSVRGDLRRCLYPLCGGVWVKRINYRSTTCADGTRASECYVAEENFSALGLSEEQVVELRNQADMGRLVLKGDIKPKSFGSFGNLGELVVSEAWTAGGSTEPTGIFYRVNDKGLRCITYPCPSHSEKKLNTSFERSIAGVDLQGAGATEEAIGAAYQQMTETQGVLVAGSHIRTSGPAGTMWALKGTQFYTQVKKKACPGVFCTLWCEYGFKTGTDGCPTCSCNDPPAKTCYVGGCSGEICSDQQGVASICIWRAEFACYKTAKCAVQPDGNCGWTPTEELKACLANP